MDRELFRRPRPSQRQQIVALIVFAIFSFALGAYTSWRVKSCAKPSADATETQK